MFQSGDQRDQRPGHYPSTPVPLGRTGTSPGQPRDILSVVSSRTTRILFDPVDVDLPIGESFAVIDPFVTKALGEQAVVTLKPVRVH